MLKKLSWNNPILKKKIIKFIDKIMQLIFSCLFFKPLLELWFFQAWISLIQSDILHQSCSNCFWMAVNRFFFGGAFSRIIFLKIHHKFSIGFRSWLFTGHICWWFSFPNRKKNKKKTFYIPPWKKKSFNTLCSVTKCIIVLKNDFVITKTFFYQWNEKVIALPYIRGSLNKFPDFFIWALLLIVHTWNSSPLWSNLFWLQCTCCTVPTTSGRPHGSSLVWACQWPSSQPLSSPQLSHNDSLWA